VRRKELVRKAESPSKRGIAWPRWTGFRGRTIWDWLQLLIIPFVLAVIGFYFTSAQEYAHQLELEARRAAEARKLEAQRVQNAALQTYLEGMRQLLLDKDLLAAEEGSSLRAVATAQTLSSLGQMSPEGKGIALRFLYESALVRKENLIVDLENADLSNADLSAADLSNVDLDEAILRGADLKTAILSDANLRNADLRNADLSNADLHLADLRFADLSHADLCCNADLSAADLSSVILRNADLGGAYLSYANLTKADLSNADLRGAQGITNEELEQQAASLEGATMPNGQKYEDWLKDKEGRGKDVEN
jgi:Pentapeptide repeats (8 copies)